MDQPGDRALVSKIRQGETEAFGLLVSRYQHSVFNVCYRMLGERLDAEDLTQETFLRAYQKLGSFDEQRPFGPWVRTVAANLCLNHLKRKSLKTVTIVEEIDARKEGLTNPEENLLGASQVSDMHAAILSLTPHYRAVIELRHFQNLSYLEIADQLNIPLSDVKSHLFRARKRIAEELKSE